MDEPDGVTTRGSTSGSSLLSLEIFVDDFGLQVVRSSVFVMNHRNPIKEQNHENVNV